MSEDYEDEEVGGDEDYDEDGNLKRSGSGYGFDGVTAAVLVAGRCLDNVTRNQMRALQEVAERWSKTLARDVVSVPCGDVSDETGATDDDDAPSFVDVLFGVEIASAEADDYSATGPHTLDALREQTIDALRALPEEMWNEVEAALRASSSDDDDEGDDDEGDDDEEGEEESLDYDEDDEEKPHEWLRTPLGRVRRDEGLYVGACGPLPSGMVAFGVIAGRNAEALEGLRVYVGTTMEQESHDEGCHGVLAADCEFSSQAVDLGDAAHDGRVTATSALTGKTGYFLIPRYD